MFQMRIELSNEAEARSSSGENARQVTESVCPRRVRIDSPVAFFQILMVLSPEAEAIFLPSAENITPLTILVCPFSMRNWLPDLASQSEMVLSLEADAMVAPS